MSPPKISPQTRVGVGARTSGQTSQTEIDSSDGSSDSDLNRGDKTNQREHFPVPMPGSSPAITSATEEASKTFNSHSHQRNADESIEKPSPGVGVSGKSYRESTRAWLEANTRNNGGSSSGLDDDEKAKKGRSSSSKLLAKRTYGSPAFSPGSGIVGSARTSTTNTTPPTNGRRKGVSNARNRTRAGSDGSDRTSTPASGYAADCSPGGRDSARAAVIEGTKKLTKGRARFQAPASGGDSRSKGVEGGKDEVENSGPGEREDGGWTCVKCTYDNEPKRRRCFMCNSCPPAGAQLRVRSVTDGALQKQKEQQQAEKSSSTRLEASGSMKADDRKICNGNDVVGAGGVGPKESDGKSRNKRVQTGSKGGARAAAMADASAESIASGEWDMLGDGGGGSTESSSKRTRSKRLSATPIHPTPLPKTGNLRGDNTEGKKQQQGQITSSPELSSHIRNVSAGAAPDSSKRAGSRHANKAIEVGPVSGGSSTFQGYERGVGGGEARAKSVSQGEEEAVGEAAVRLFPGVGSFPKLPGFSLPMVEDVDRVSILGGLGQGVNSKGRALEACDEEALSSGGTGHGGSDEALEGSMDGDLGRGGGLNGVEEPDTVSKRMESNTDYDDSSDSNDGQASDGSKATGKRGRKRRVERGQARVSPRASPGGKSLASGRTARKTGRATGTAPESVDEAHRAASLLVAMRPSAPKAVEAEAEASREFPTGGVGTKGEAGGGKGRRRKVSSPVDSPVDSSKNGTSAKGKASGGGEMSSGSRIGNSESRKGGGKKRRKTSDVSDSNTPDIGVFTGKLMAKTGDDKKGKKKQENKIPVEVSTSKRGGKGSSTSSGGGSKLTVGSNVTKVTGKRKGRECKEGIGGKGVRGGKGPGDGTKKEESSQEKRPKELEGVVRVAFSGLSPADRQAATSMVRSLSKKRKKPAGSGACNSDGEAFTHLVIPDESRRTLKVLFALCAPLGPNGMPPVVVTISWLYASLDAGYFVDNDAFRPARYLGPQSESDENAKTVNVNSGGSHSISSRLLCGEIVMVGGVADPSPDVVEDLARAAGAEVTVCLREATLLLVGSKHELQEWVDGEKAAVVLGGRASKKIRAGGRRNLVPSTASARYASLSNRGDIRARVPGFLADEGKRKSKKRGFSETGGATWGGSGWGKEEDDALSALKSAGSVVCLQWFFDSVERGVVVDREEFIIQGGGDAEEVADLEDIGSQEW